MRRPLHTIRRSSIEATQLATDVAAVTAAAAKILDDTTLLGVTGTQVAPVLTIGGTSLSGPSFYLTLAGSLTIGTTAGADEAPAQTFTLKDCALYAVDATYDVAGLVVLWITGNTVPMTLRIRNMEPTGYALGYGEEIHAASCKITSVVVDAGCFLGCKAAGGNDAVIDLSGNEITDYGNLFALLADVTDGAISVDVSGGTNASLTAAEWEYVVKACGVSSVTIFYTPTATIHIASAADYPAAVGDYTWNGEGVGVFWKDGAGPQYIKYDSVTGKYLLTDDDALLLNSTTLFGSDWHNVAADTDVITTFVS